MDCGCTYNIVWMESPTYAYAGSRVTRSPAAVTVSTNPCPLHKAAPKLLTALEECQAALDVLLCHFGRGTLRDTSGLGGTLSNMAAEIEVLAREAIKEAKAG